MIVETVTSSCLFLSFLVLSIIITDKACNLAWKIRQIITKLAISLRIKFRLLTYELDEDIHECLKVCDAREIEVTHII